MCEGLKCLCEGDASWWLDGLEHSRSFDPRGRPLDAHLAAKTWRRRTVAYMEPRGAELAFCRSRQQLFVSPPPAAIAATASSTGHASPRHPAPPQGRLAATTALRHNHAAPRSAACGPRGRWRPRARSAQLPLPLQLPLPPCPETAVSPIGSPSGSASRW